MSSTVPANAATDVSRGGDLAVTFSEEMDASTITSSTVTLMEGSSNVAGTVSYSGVTATFEANEALEADTTYTATVAASASDTAGNPLPESYRWTFTTGSTTSQGPDPVDLGTAGGFVLLAKSGIDTIPSSVVTGNVGVSPIDSTAITGFSLTNDASNEFSMSTQVVGQVQAADYSSPTPTELTTAIGDMETAYTDAAGRPTPDHSELGAGEIGGLTLAPGLYKWGTGVSITTDLTLDGGPNDTWIFQISGDLTQASGTNVILMGGAAPKNIVWQTFGQATIGSTAHLEGVVLCQTAIVLETGASVNGRLLAQTAVTLDQNVVTQPSL